MFYPVLDELADLNYYYNDWYRSRFDRFPGFECGFDVVVFCARDYTRINQSTFRKVGRVTVGISSANTRPDLFDYTIPTSVNYAFTVN